MTRIPRGVATVAVAIACATIAAAALAHVPGVAWASDPVGIYALPDRVETLDADGLAPQVRIEGVFALAWRDDGGVARYSDPQAGYLLLRCPAGHEAACEREWGDLKTVVGTGQCAAFGHRYETDPKPPARVRPRGEPPSEPDLYPIGQGVVFVSHGPCTGLLESRTLTAVEITAPAKITAPGQFTPAAADPTAVDVAALTEAPDLAGPGSEPVQSGSAFAAADTDGSEAGRPALFLGGIVFLAVGWTAVAWFRGRHER
jgi:hypothetical protein